MELGAFSISLAVKDLARSRAFYEKLGFSMTGGDGEAWAILVNGDTVIGLFQGMFEKNLLTFNPGWSGPGQAKEGFTDVRELCKALEAAGLEPKSKQLEGDSGPGHITLEDPDGNPILIDQHV